MQGTVFASLFDINNDGVDAQDILIVLGVLGTIRLAFWGAAKQTAKLFRGAVNGAVAEELEGWCGIVENLVDDKLRTYTAPIQKDANGDFSLPDAAREARHAKLIATAVAEHFGIDIPDVPDKDKKHGRRYDDPQEVPDLA